jgi:hypothetical protein
VTIRVSEVIRGWLGWCPNTHARVRKTDIRFNDEPMVPSSGGSFKGQIVRWFGLFRNQVLLYSLVISATGFWMFAGLGGGSSPALFIIGILAGLPLSAVTGIWYLRIFNEVIREGPVVLMNRQDKTSGTLTGLGLAVSLIPVLVLFGVLPGVTMEMMIAFIGGFVAVLLWGLFIAIMKWESGTHRQLHFDGMILQLEKEDTYAVR